LLPCTQVDKGEGAERRDDGRESNKRSVLWWRKARAGATAAPKTTRDPARHRVFRCTFESAIRQPAPAIVLR